MKARAHDLRRRCTKTRAFRQYLSPGEDRLTAEKAIIVYMIGGGPQAVAVPESVYPRDFGISESFLFISALSAPKSLN